MKRSKDRGTIRGGTRPVRGTRLVLAALLVVPATATQAQQRVESPFQPSATPSVERTMLAGDAAADTTRRRPVAIEYSDWYGRRLKLHQVASWTMLPLFAVQYAAGQQLLDKGKYGASSWARDLHAPLAGALGVLFGINTVTGGWNLWDARKDPAGRKWRTAHSVLMLVADAGFALTPAFVDGGSDGGGASDSNLRTHRNVAIASMGIATASWIMMLPPFRHE